MDGYSTVDQGAAGVVKSKGSQMVRCDPVGLFNWWTSTAPLNFTPPLDENGVKLRLCSQCGEWVRRSGFAKDSTRKDGLDSTCKQCRHDNYLKGKASSKM